MEWVLENLLLLDPNSVNEIVNSNFSWKDYFASFFPNEPEDNKIEKKNSKKKNYEMKKINNLYFDVSIIVSKMKTDFKIKFTDSPDLGILICDPDRKVLRLLEKSRIKKIIKKKKNFFNFVLYDPKQDIETELFLSLNHTKDITEFTKLISFFLGIKLEDANISCKTQETENSHLIKNTSKKSNFFVDGSGYIGSILKAYYFSDLKEKKTNINVKFTSIRWYVTTNPGNLEKNTFDKKILLSDSMNFKINGIFSGRYIKVDAFIEELNKSFNLIIGPVIPDREYSLSIMKHFILGKSTYSVIFKTHELILLLKNMFLVPKNFLKNFRINYNNVTIKCDLVADNRYVHFLLPKKILALSDEKILLRFSYKELALCLPTPFVNNKIIQNEIFTNEVKMIMIAKDSAYNIVLNLEFTQYNEMIIFWHRAILSNQIDLGRDQLKLFEKDLIINNITGIQKLYKSTWVKLDWENDIINSLLIPETFTKDISQELIVTEKIMGIKKSENSSKRNSKSDQSYKNKSSKAANDDLDSGNQKKQQENRDSECYQVREVEEESKKFRLMEWQSSESSVNISDSD